MNKKETAIREEFKKFTIMGCHPGKSYEEVLVEEEEYQTMEDHADGSKTVKILQKHFPITIGRVMQTLENSLGESNLAYYSFCISGIWIEQEATNKYGKDKQEHICTWKLTKENGQECTDDDQPIETITKLLNLLK